MVASEVVGAIMENVDEAITVIETTQIIPDYNANLTVEQAMRTARLRILPHDYRVDDQFITDEDLVEPFSTTIDNYMKEGIDIKP